MNTRLEIEWIVADRVGVLKSTNPAESHEVQQQLEAAGFTQMVTVREWPFTMAWRLPGCDLRNFMIRVTTPEQISLDSQLSLDAFCVYELRHARRVPIWFEDDRVRDAMVGALCQFFAAGQENMDSFLETAPAMIRGRYAALPSGEPRRTGCRYCHEGACHSDLVCHGTTIEKAVQVIGRGAILSAVRARDIPAECSQAR